SPGKRLERQGSGPSVEVEHRAAVEALAEEVEERLPHPVGSRAEPRALRAEQRATAVGAGDDPHLVLRPGCGEQGEAAETEARRRTREASSGGVPRGTSSGRAWSRGAPAPLLGPPPGAGGVATRLRVAARGSADVALRAPRSEH